MKLEFKGAEMPDMALYQAANDVPLYYCIREDAHGDERHYSVWRCDEDWGLIYPLRAISEDVQIEMPTACFDFLSRVAHWLIERGEVDCDNLLVTKLKLEGVEK